MDNLMLISAWMSSGCSYVFIDLLPSGLRIHQYELTCAAACVDDDGIGIDCYALAAVADFHCLLAEIDGEPLRRESVQTQKTRSAQIDGLQHRRLNRRHHATSIRQARNGHRVDLRYAGYAVDPHRIVRGDRKSTRLNSSH